MKKLYLFSMLGMLMLGANQIFAQCGTPAIRNYYINNNCVVLANLLPPNRTVLLTNYSAQVISSTTTDADGFAALTYPCEDFAYRVVVLLEDGSCSNGVPPQAILPVKLSSFTAELKSNSTVSLKWTSSMEITSYKYVVQKSNDGLNFSDIGEVPAAGNSATPLNYNYADNNFISGASYFRLKQVDIDGKFEFSKVVYVNNSKSGSGLVTAVIPNPFVSDVQLIGINSSELNSKNVRLFNSFGQRVNYRITGSNAIEIDPSAARGIYILKIKEQTFKLVKN